jgi:hypothetical protein
MKAPLWIVLSLVLRAAALHATEVEVAGPTTITPANTFAHYNTTGITIGSYLYLYQQGAGDISDTTCPNGDKIIAYRALITAGVPGAFQRVGRISPCAQSPACTGTCSPWPAASYGPGQIFQATIGGVTKYHLLADASNTADFHNVWHGESTDGINWSWTISDTSQNMPQTETVQESAGLPGGDVVSHTIVSTVASNAFLHSDSFVLLNPIMLPVSSANNADWWGFVNTGNGPTALKIAWSTGSPVVSVLTGTSPSWTYTTVTNGDMTGVSPVILAAGANVKTLLQEPPASGNYQLWGSAPVNVPAYASSVGCTTTTNATCSIGGGCPTGDGSHVANGFTGSAFLWNTGPAGTSTTCTNCSSGFFWWPVTSSSFGGTNGVYSMVRSLPSGYEVSRLFPFRWNSPTGNRYLFSATNDNHICNEFLFSGFFKMYVVRTTVADQ